MLPVAGAVETNSKLETLVQRVNVLLVAVSCSQKQVATTDDLVASMETKSLLVFPKVSCFWQQEQTQGNNKFLNVPSVETKL